MAKTIKNTSASSRKKQSRKVGLITFASPAVPKKEFAPAKSHRDGVELFSIFTADIIKQNVIFTR